MYSTVTTHTATFTTESRLNLIREMLQLSLTLVQNEDAEFHQDKNGSDEELADLYQHLCDSLAALEAVDSDFGLCPCDRCVAERKD